MNSVSISIKAIYHEYRNEVFDLTPVAFQCALAAYLITGFKKEATQERKPNIKPAPPQPCDSATGSFSAKCALPPRK